MEPDFDSVDGLRVFLQPYSLTPESVKKFVNANQGRNDVHMTRKSVFAIKSFC